MDFLEHIVEKENKFLAEVKKLEEEGNPIYIYGAASGGKQVANRLLQEGINHGGMVVDTEYWQEGSSAQRLEDVLGQAEGKINLIIAFKGFQGKKLVPYREKIHHIVDWDCWAGNHEVDSSYLTYGWVLENYTQLQSVYQRLADETSKETFTAYLNQKISFDYKYLKRTKSSCQYFEDGIMELSGEEVFVDCGAYDGDSAVAFTEALKRQGISTYDAIISFEPDKYNYEKLCRRGLENHTCICKGVSDTVGDVHFSEAGTSGRVVGNAYLGGSNGQAIGKTGGDTAVGLDTIDHMLQGRRATIIKMDIEGFELPALKGAEETITKWKPKLAVCIYHKKEDLWEIADYIHRIEPKYKLYMRNYEDTATELVLYAVMG